MISNHSKTPRKSVEPSHEKTSLQSPMNEDPVMFENFQEEIDSIKEKGKDLKGEKKNFFNSIVQRIESSVQILSDLREEHSGLRKRLGELVEAKKTRKVSHSVQKVTKRVLHDVNLLKKQIDQLKHSKEEAIKKQEELKLILENYKTALEEEIKDDSASSTIRSELDKVSIRIHETNNLIKVYSQVKHLISRQKMWWNPDISEKHNKIEKKEKDIAELVLISRDSKHSRDVASNEYKMSDTMMTESRAKREIQLDTLKKKYRATMNYPQRNVSMDDNPKTQPSQNLGQHNSILRTKANKVAREKKEEKLNSQKGLLEQIYSVFDTSSPDEINNLIQTRRQTSITLNEQIDSIKNETDLLTFSLSAMNSEIENLEYRIKQDAGGNRVLNEGKRILDSTNLELEELTRVLDSNMKYEKYVEKSIAHLYDLYALVTTNTDFIPSSPLEIVKWCQEKALFVDKSLKCEDTCYSEIINPQVFLLHQQIEANLDLAKVDSSKRIQKRTVDPLRRPAKEQKTEEMRRVLDRLAVKNLSTKVFMNSQIKKPVVK